MRGTPTTRGIRKPGRPTDAEKSAVVHIRTTPEEKRRWVAASKGQFLSEWLRNAANQAASNTTQ